MDRLYVVAVVACAVVGTGCDQGESSVESRGTQSRVNAVQAEEDDTPAPEAYCGQYWKAAEAPSFAFPELRGEPPAPTDGWRWINVWATWCDPCVEEMPRLVEWRDELSEAGLTDLILVSFDAERSAVEKFRRQHPETPESLLVTTPEAGESWVKSLGLSAGGSLPIHIFVDGENRVRCLRAGGVGEDDYDAIERILGG